MVLYYLIKISFLIETNLALRGMYNKKASIKVYCEYFDFVVRSIC